MHSTEKRILYVGPHRKTHSAGEVSRKGAFCPDRLTERRTLRFPDRAECAFPSRCGAREVWGNRPPGCGALWKMVQLGKCARATTRQPAGRVVPGSANLGSESGLTERRILYPAAHGKTHSGCWPHGKTHSPSPHHQNPQFDGSGDCRMRFSDRRMRFSVTFRNHPDCIALSRHLRNPLTAPSHV